MTSFACILKIREGHTFYGAASATNTIGTAYSDTISWSTVVDVTASLTSVHGSSAVVTASFAYDEAAPTEVGFSWSESADLSNATDSTVTLANDNTATLRIPLEGETQYYVTAYAINARGTSTGDTLSLTTYVALTNDNIDTAVEDWVNDEATATTNYGPISEWDVSNVTNMSSLFMNYTGFNADISAWDVSNVTFMNNMFNNADAFTGDLSSWDVSNVTRMDRMFNNNAGFNGDLSNWDVSSVTNMKEMFWKADGFNGDISTWDVSNVVNMESMFEHADLFNGDLSAWDVSSVTNMNEMFRTTAAFEGGDLSGWNTASLTNMYGMFWQATVFTGDVSTWDVDGVTDMLGTSSTTRETSMEHSTIGTYPTPPTWVACLEMPLFSIKI